MARIQTSGLTSRYLPLPSFTKVSANTPRLRPVAMLNVNGMATSVRKAPSDARDGAAHQNSHEHERRSRGIGRNRCDQWRAKHSQEKQHRDNDVAQTRTRAGCHPGSTLDVTRNCGSARERAKHRPDGVSQQSAAGAWKLPISQEPAPLANTDKRPTLSNRSTKRKTKISSPSPIFAAARKSSCRRVPEGCGREKKRVGQ
jgi:hypothetical protein